jgi:hypothetical protein
MPGSRPATKNEDTHSGTWIRMTSSFHPGWVRTTMLYCGDAPLEPLESIGGMIQVIESLEMKDSGRFFDWKGNEIPW